MTIIYNRASVSPDRYTEEAGRHVISASEHSNVATSYRTCAVTLNNESYVAIIPSGEMNVTGSIGSGEHVTGGGWSKLETRVHTSGAISSEANIIYTDVKQTDFEQAMRAAFKRVEAGSPLVIDITREGLEKLNTKAPKAEKQLANG